MLVLSRERDECIVVGDDIVITIVEIRGDKVRLGFEGPRETTFHRHEVYRNIREQLRERPNASQTNTPAETILSQHVALALPPRKES